jgi:hypothetical protein
MLANGYMMLSRERHCARLGVREYERPVLAGDQWHSAGESKTATTGSLRLSMFRYPVRRVPQVVVVGMVAAARNKTLLWFEVQRSSAAANQRHRGPGASPQQQAL